MAPMASFTECICAAACPMAMAAKSVAFLFFSDERLQLAQRHRDHVEFPCGGVQVILRRISIRALVHGPTHLRCSIIQMCALSVDFAGQSRFALRAKRFTGHANPIWS